MWKLMSCFEVWLAAEASISVSLWNSRRRSGSSDSSGSSSGRRGIAGRFLSEPGIGPP